MAIKEVLVPDIGNFDSVDVIEVHVKADDSVNQEDSLITLESDKASMDIPSPFSGTVKEVKIKVGDKAAQGVLIALVEAAEGAAEAFRPAAAPPPVVTSVAAVEIAAPSKPVPEVPKPIAPQGTPNPVAARAEFAPGKNPHASPSVRKFARELGTDLTRVTGSGPKGRISKEDVQAWVKGELARPRAEATAGGMNVLAMPVFDFSQYGPVETQALPRIKKISGANLHRNWVTAPHVTQFDDADITDLEDFRKSMQDEAGKRGVKLTMLAFLMKARGQCPAHLPQLQCLAVADRGELVLKQYYHIGFACDTPDGLVVPVIRDVNKKDVMDIARDLAELSARARERKLKIERNAGRLLHHLQPGRHRRHHVHAHHQLLRKWRSSAFPVPASSRYGTAEQEL